MSSKDPPWNTYQTKFKREWVCVNCGYTSKNKLPACPKCGGYLAARNIKI